MNSYDIDIIHSHYKTYVVSWRSQSECRTSSVKVTAADLSEPGQIQISLPGSITNQLGESVSLDQGTECCITN